MMVFRGRSEVFRGRSEVFRGRSEVFRGHSGVFRGRSEVFRGRSEVFRGHSGVFRGRSEVFRGRSKQLATVEEDSARARQLLEQSRFAQAVGNSDVDEAWREWTRSSAGTNACEGDSEKFQ
ncbi:hypothetical protein DIPPA_03701 [Diplonema papillatum]|nr:hypothetical protein DIPPA_03701 [Diplonema papillatum]